MYSMPIVGTSARLYFPNEESEEPIVTGCVRTNGSSCAKTSDTTNRYFGTEHGSEIEMTPGSVNIKGGSKEPLSISFDDKVGVTLKSPKNLNLNSDDDIIIKTPASVNVKAQSQIGITKSGTENGFSVETDMHFKGGNVIKDGSDREAFAPFDDEPKAGTKPEPPAPPPEKKKGFSWGSLLVAAVAVVACAAVGAAEGAKNSIDSQLASNGGDSSKVNYAEAAKAAFFGAVTGAKDMFLTEACAAYDTLNQTASFMFDVCTLGSFHNSCKDFSEWSHEYLRNASPYKEGFDDAEFVINTALLADGMFSIGNIVKNIPKKFSVGQFSLAELGVNIPVVCSDGSIALVASGDLASIGGAGSAMYNMSNNKSGNNQFDSDRIDVKDGKRSTRSENSLRKKLENRTDAQGNRIYSDKEIDDIMNIRNSEYELTLENGDKITIKRHGYQKNDAVGQSHHLNQDAAYREIIPKEEGLAIDADGNVFMDPESSHYKAHESMEQFWDKYRDGGEFEGIKPTVGEYNSAKTGWKSKSIGVLPTKTIKPEEIAPTRMGSGKSSDGKPKVVFGITKSPKGETIKVNGEVPNFKKFQIEDEDYILWYIIIQTDKLNIDEVKITSDV